MNLSNTQRVARYIKVIFLMTKKNAVIIITAVFYFTASFNCLPGLKAGVTDAGISISSPVCGLRPLRAARLRVSKVPKPYIQTDRDRSLINCPFFAPFRLCVDDK